MAGINPGDVAHLIAKELKRQQDLGRTETTALSVEEFTWVVVVGFIKLVRSNRTTPEEIKSAIRANLQDQAANRRLTLPPETGDAVIENGQDWVRVVGRIDLNELAAAIAQVGHV